MKDITSTDTSQTQGYPFPLRVRTLPVSSQVYNDVIRSEMTTYLNSLGLSDLAPDEGVVVDIHKGDQVEDAMHWTALAH